MSSLPALTFPPPASALALLPQSQKQTLTPTMEEIDDISSDDGVTKVSSPAASKWFFSNERLRDTPSRRSGLDEDKELTLRQQSANFIQDIGQRLQVNQLCINTAIVYMHRFYMYHSFTLFPKNAISTASIFLAAKVEEQPRKLEYVIKIAHYCLYRESAPGIDLKSESYAAQSSELVSNENILLQTLGFDVSVDHPHTHVVKCCQLVRASKDLAQTSYFMATNSLHLTTMCLQYQPSVVACVCIHLACKWSNWEIPRSKESKEWYCYVDESVTPEQLDLLTTEFLTIFNKSPSRLKKKILSLSAATSGGAGGSGGALTNFPTHFMLDRNSSGGQTITSRSRSPSPAGLPGTSKPRLPPGGLPKPIPGQLMPQHKPVKPGPGGLPPPHHYNMKQPGPYTGLHKPAHGGPLKPQYPHAQGQSHSTGPHGPKDGLHLPLKPVPVVLKQVQPFPPHHSASNGAHGQYHPPRPHHPHPQPHHGSGSHSHPAPKPLLGSQSGHHYPPRPGHPPPPPPNHVMYKQAPHNLGPPKPLFPHLPGPHNQKDGGQQHGLKPGGPPGTYPPHPPPSNGAHGYHGTRPSHPPHPSSASGQPPPQGQFPGPPKPLLGPRPNYPPESLKRRQPEPAQSTLVTGRLNPGPNAPALKRPRQEGAHPPPAPAVAEEVRINIKREDLPGHKKQFKNPPAPVKVEAILQEPPKKVNPIPSSQPNQPGLSMPSLAFASFPLLSSEIAGNPNLIKIESNPPARPIPQVLPPAPLRIPQPLPAPVEPILPSSPSADSVQSDSSSSKKKKKKKEHKHKKEKSHKEGRRHKEEKKHKKDKHRDRDGEKEKHKSSKHHHRTPGTNNHAVAETVLDQKLKIKISIPPKDPKDAAGKHSKKPQAQPPVTATNFLYF